MEKFNFEDSMQALGEIIKELDDDIELERSIELYKRANDIAYAANKFLNSAEAEILVLKEELGKIELSPLKNEENYE